MPHSEADAGRSSCSLSRRDGSRRLRERRRWLPAFLVCIVVTLALGCDKDEFLLGAKFFSR